MPPLQIPLLKVFLFTSLVIDLPKLYRISLGKYALRGSDNWSCEVTMKSSYSLFTSDNNIDLNRLSTLESEGYSFDYPRSVVIHCGIILWIIDLDVNYLSTVDLPCGWFNKAFSRVTSASLICCFMFLFSVLAVSSKLREYF